MNVMLTPGATGFIAVKDGQGTEIRTSADMPAPRFFQYWDRAGFTAHLEHGGYEVLRYEPRPASETSWAWHQFLARKK